MRRKRECYLLIRKDSRVINKQMKVSARDPVPLPARRTA
jgi:hypothetical protein